MSAEVPPVYGPPAFPRPALLSRLPWLGLTWVTLVVALVVAKSQVSRLAASELDAQHRSWGLDALTGWSAYVSRAGWESFGVSPFRQACLLVYAGLDVVLVVLYALALHRYLTNRFPERRLRLLLPALLGSALVVVDVVTWAVGRHPLSASGASALAAVSTVAGIAETLAVVAVGWDWFTRRSPGRRLSTAYEVVRLHRFSVLPVLVLGVLLVAPGANILDQVPDIERRWAEGAGNLAAEGLPGFLIMFLAAGALFLLGRARVAQACRTFEGCGQDPLPAPRAWPWLVVAGGLVLVGVVLSTFSPVTWSRLVIFAAVPAVVGGSTLLVRWLQKKGKGAVPATTPPTWSLQRLRLALVTGDVIAFGLLALSAIGAVRALTPVAVLVLAPGGTSITTPLVYCWLVLGVGAAGVLGVWFGADRLLAGLTAAAPGTPAGRLHAWVSPSPGEQRPAIAATLPRGILVTSLAAVVALGCFPSVIGHGGVLLVFVGGILTLTGLVSGVALLAAGHEPAPLFSALRLRSTPMVALLLATVVFAGQVDDRTPLHRIRDDTDQAGAAAALARRPDLATLVSDWAATQTTACRPVANGVQLLPMVLLASEGGGIKAAYWTTDVTDRIGADPCAARSTLLSSGVSGGAVGLAVARSVRPGTGSSAAAAQGEGPATQVVQAMSNSRALSFGLAGLLLRDFAYATTGLPLPLYGDHDPSAYVDRAALIEQAWNTSDTGATGWRDATVSGWPTSGNPVVGAVVLNSMSVGNACRVWVSEVRLRPSTDRVDSRGDGKIDCDDAGVSGVRSVDLLSAYDLPATSGDAAQTCLSDLRAQTAALLAARFPYVTPSGQLASCPHDGSGGMPPWTAPGDQLVDGGYLENTGLGTITDTADAWLPAVQQWNAAHETTGPGGSRQLIQPVVVYLDNDSGADLSPATRDVTSEGVLPPLAWLRATGGPTRDDTTLQRAADVVSPEHVCTPGDDACLTALMTTDHTLFVVYPRTTPQISAPLGWILSDASRSAMNQAIQSQTDDGCVPRPDDVTDRRDVVTSAGSLCDLRKLVDQP